MATVRFSQDLKASIRNRASALFDEPHKQARAAFGEDWARRVYDGMFRTSGLHAKMADLPACFTQKTNYMSLSGYTTVPGGGGVVSLRTYLPTLDLGLEEIFPLGEVSKSADCKLLGVASAGWGRYSGGIVLDGDDPRWATLIPEMRAYLDNILKVEQERKEFVAGVEKIMGAFSTLAPALKEWPPLWDLLDESVKARHREVVERKKSTPKVAGDVDLSRMTAAVTKAKLTR